MDPRATRPDPRSPTPDLNTVIRAPETCALPPDASVPLPDKFTREGDNFIPVGKEDPRPAETDGDTAARLLCDGLREDLTGSSGARISHTLMAVANVVLVRVDALLNAEEVSLPNNHERVVSASKSLLQTHKGYPKVHKMFPDDLAPQERAIRRIEHWRKLREVFSGAATILEKNEARELNLLDTFNRAILPRVEAAFPDDVFLQLALKPVVLAVRGPAQQAVKTKARDARVLATAVKPATAAPADPAAPAAEPAPLGSLPVPRTNRDGKR